MADEVHRGCPKSVISMSEAKSAKGIPLGKSPHPFQKEISHSPRRIRIDNPELFVRPRSVKLKLILHAIK